MKKTVVVVGAFLTEVDKAADYIPIVSTVTNIFNVFVKIVCVTLGAGKKVEKKNHPYIYHVINKEGFRYWSIVPVFGNIYVYLRDKYSDAERYEEKNSALEREGGGEEEPSEIESTLLVDSPANLKKRGELFGRSIYAAIQEAIIDKKAHAALGDKPLLALLALTKEQLSSQQLLAPPCSEEGESPEKYINRLSLWMEGVEVKPLIETLKALSCPGFSDNRAGFDELTFLQIRQQSNFTDSTIELLAPLFVKLRGIQKIDLSNHELKNIPSFFFKLPSLEHLILEGNKISDLPNTTITQLNSSAIEKIYLMKNPLTDEARKKVVGNRTASVLDEGRKKILLSLCIGLRKIISGAFPNSELPQVPNYSEIGSAKEYSRQVEGWLKESDINNFLEGVSEFSFHKESISFGGGNRVFNIKLEGINISDGTLEDLAPLFFRLVNLKKIDLSYGFLTKIPDLIVTMRQLEEVDLEGNVIVDISDAMLASLNRMEFMRGVNLNYNPLNPSLAAKINCITHPDLRCKVFCHYRPDHEKILPPETHEEQSEGPTTIKVVCDRAKWM